MGIRKRYTKWWKVIIWLTISVTVFFLAQLFVMQWCIVPSESMQNTLQPGDCILVNKMVYGPRMPGKFSNIPVLNMLELIPSVEKWREEKHMNRLPGYGQVEHLDVVVFWDVEQPQRLLVKRVVALPNDVLQIKDGCVWVNGEAVREPAGVIPNDSLTNGGYVLNGVKKGWTQGNYGPIKVPPFHVFMLGDNRGNSFDSRFYGFVPERNIIGKVAIVLYSRKDGHWNWERFFLRVK